MLRMNLDRDEPRYIRSIHTSHIICRGLFPSAKAIISSPLQVSTVVSEAASFPLTVFTFANEVVTSPRMSAFATEVVCFLRRSTLP